MGMKAPESSHLFSNRGEPVQPFFCSSTESTAIGITTAAAAILQATELEPLQWLLPEEGVLRGIEIIWSGRGGGGGERRAAAAIRLDAPHLRTRTLAAAAAASGGAHLGGARASFLGTAIPPSLPRARLWI
jgi:hypothetical protein